MIWAPNPNYELSKSSGVYSFTANGIPEDSYKYYIANGGSLNDLQLYTIGEDEYANKQFVAGSTGGDITTSGSSPVLTVLDKKINETDTVYTKTIKLRIWFEGTDREADQALSGGWVNMVFKFNGMQKSPAEAAKQQAINDLAIYQGEIRGLQDGMVYSDDGREWLTYSSANPPVFASGSTYFFKYPETETNYETTYNKLTISA